MCEPVIISECKDPWLYWWRLSSPAEWQRRRLTYCPEKGLTQSLAEEDIRRIWEGEEAKPLDDENWIQLAERILKGFKYSTKEQEEVWRQVYRIASARL